MPKPKSSLPHTPKTTRQKKSSTTPKVPKPSSSKVRNPKKELTRLRSLIIDAIKDIKGEKIVSLELSHLSEAIADYFIICEASTITQLKGIADNIEKRVKEENGQTVYRRNVDSQSPWMVLDYIDIVVHLLLPEQRQFYNIEECWSDAIIHLEE